ncbi:hypothetical protein [Mucilaginibacter myungsuensis]|uniref:Uncharacterized protein n=1 Tax=Mucilaginibacter myungsuensis TaxID=649104 RepID=A0A929KZV1_9SPHI|nr:hypothetical protein [Mucilaginibacter myungsuensis]MBE9661904.1 hypothetical protein [Mucilaginibacter myungsuensis]MDN3599662.1 hypothetical protein [Mucilaginibacter myungsuensis]
MNRTFVSKQIKLEILTVCDAPISQPDNLIDSIQLSLLGYDEYEGWCRQLETRLQQIAVQYHTGKQILQGDITANITVDQCINMVV